MPVSLPRLAATSTRVSTAGPAVGGAKDDPRKSLILPNTRSKPMIRRDRRSCALVGDLQQAGAKGGRGKGLRDLDRSAAWRSSQLRCEQGAGDGMPEAHLALNQLEQVIERAGVVANS